MSTIPIIHARKGCVIVTDITNLEPKAGSLKMPIQTVENFQQEVSTKIVGNLGSFPRSPTTRF